MSNLNLLKVPQRRCVNSPSHMHCDRGRGRRHHHEKKQKVISSWRIRKVELQKKRGRRARHRGAVHQKDDRVPERPGRRRKGREDGARMETLLNLMSMSMRGRARLLSVVDARRRSRLDLRLPLHRRPIPILDRAVCFDHDARRVSLTRVREECEIEGAYRRAVAG